ncbi:PDZ-binding CRIPT protein [Rutstroemia sp. NJR-2017a BVV2]|nr:PDZ-binding CRIPT protein [Rutstroemia sp. NJR-2017a BVV2]
MVCAKCQKKPQSTTALATPEVKKKNDMYYGSPAAGSSKAATKTSATLGNNGIGKVRCQSFAAYIATATDIEPAE